MECMVYVYCQINAVESMNDMLDDRISCSWRLSVFVEFESPVDGIQKRFQALKGINATFHPGTKIRTTNATHGFYR